MFHSLRDVWCIQKILGSVVQPWYTVVKSSSLLYGLKYKFEPFMASTSFPVEKNLYRVCKVAWLSYRYLFKNRGSGGGNKRPHKRKVKEDKFESHDGIIYIISVQESFPKKLFQIPIWNFPPQTSSSRNFSLRCKIQLSGGSNRWKKPLMNPTNAELSLGVVLFFGGGKS